MNKTILIIFYLLVIIILCGIRCFGREYTASVTRVIDGDTFCVLIDLGLDVFKNETVRIYGINAPESNTKEGQIAFGFLEKALSGKTILIDNIGDKREKYGRLLCKVYLENKDVGDVMIKSKLAKEYYGGKRD